jgi:uncharacterized protein (DUF2236 family)
VTPIRFPISRSSSPDALSRVATVAWKLQKEVVLLLAWSPAILLQLAHPLVARGVADHSSFRSEPWGRTRRLYRTLDAMLGLCFGTEPEARAVAGRINAIHDRVHGELHENAGAFPAGTAYSAHDPALLAWVHATLLVMNLRVYELFVAPIGAEDKDRYCAEASAIEKYLGIPEGYLPRTVGELERYFDATLASEEIYVTDVARSLARRIVCPDAPRIAGPAFGLMRLITLGLLPPRIRDAYGFAWNTRHETVLRLSAGVIRRLLPLTPPIVRYWPAARAAFRAANPSRCPLRMFHGRGVSDAFARGCETSILIGLAGRATDSEPRRRRKF